MFEKRVPTENEKLCPYDGVAYSQVPGYESGYGCPVCKGISFYHLPVTDDPLKIIFEEFLDSVATAAAEFAAEWVFDQHSEMRIYREMWT